MSETVIIARRFRGPPNSGNGGYSCGMAARFIDGPAEVRLRAPPPLETPLEVTQDAHGVALHHGEVLIAEARPARVDLEVPPAPSRAQAEEAAKTYRGFKSHIFPGCFVCGPERTPDEALCLYCGTVREGLVAAPWTPAPDLAAADGLVDNDFLWAALDCPSYWGMPRAGSILAVLGSLAGEIHRRPAPGETLVVAGWPRGEDGRKHFSATAIYDADGACIARAGATWVELKQSL